MKEAKSELVSMLIPAELQEDVENLLYTRWTFLYRKSDITESEKLTFNYLDGYFKNNGLLKEVKRTNRKNEENKN